MKTLWVGVVLSIVIIIAGYIALQYGWGEYALMLSMLGSFILGYIGGYHERDQEGE